MNNNFKKILFYVIAAVVAFAPFARGAVRLWSVTPVLLSLYFIIFLCLGLGARPFKKTPLDACIFLFIALAVVSSVFSVNKYESVSALLRVLAFAGLYYTVLNNFDVMMRDRLLGLVVGLGTALSLYGLLQYFGKLDHSWWFPPEFLSATYVNHNHFAGFLEMVIPVAVAMLVSCPHERFYRGLCLGAIVAVLLVAFALTQSRAGWLSLALSLIVLSFALNKKTIGAKKNLFVILLIGAVIAGSLYIQKESLYKRVKVTTAFTRGEKEASFESRFMMWGASVKMARDNPFVGVGIGAFDSSFYRYRPQGLDTRAVYAHNDYLHMAAEMGILAPLLMMGILFIVLKAGFRRNAGPLILGCSAGVLSLALHGLADFNFHIPANMLLLIIYIAFIMKKQPE